MLKNPIKILFLAALSLGFVFTSASARAADVSASFQYLPDKAIAVAGVHGDKVRHSSLYKTFLRLVTQRREVERGLAEFERATGFDATKDVRSLVLGVADSFTSNSDNFVLVADAKLDEAKVLAFMRKKGAQFKTLRTRTGVHHLLGRKQDGFLAFRGRHIILGGVEQLGVLAGAGHRGMTARRGPQRSMSRALVRLKKRPLFLVVEPNAALKKRLAHTHEDFGKLTTFSVGLDVTGGAKLDMAARFASAASAANIHDLATGALKRVSNSRQSKRMGFAAIVKSVRLSKHGPTLRGSLRLTQKQLDNLLGL
ncbi:MAG TPA: hypothetical protein ENK23_05080, partial [Sorangium sp.]|nr:hypothetical protein [Sorangium sp.]